MMTQSFGAVARYFAPGDLDGVGRCLRSASPIRKKQQYFDDYCNATNVDGRRFEHEDYQSGPAFSRNHKQQLKDDIQRLLAASAFDLVFTHSRDPCGEYGGHANYVEVLQATQELVTSDRLICFSYNPEFGHNGRATTARLDADYHVQLNYEELIQKATWCQSAPDAQNRLRALASRVRMQKGFAHPGRTSLRFLFHVRTFHGAR